MGYPALQRRREQLLRVGDPLVVVADAEMGQQRLGEEGVVARLLDFGEQVPTGTAPIERIEDDLAFAEKGAYRVTHS